MNRSRRGWVTQPLRLSWGEKMKDHKSVFTLLCCYILLNFLIGVTATAVADSEIATSNTTEISEGPPLYKTIEGAKTYIVQHQNRDGGWPLVPGGDSNVESTAFAIWALIEAEWGTGSRVIRTGVAYLRNTQSEDGSWNDNTAHTIFALIALAKAETDPDARFKGLRWLRKVQNPNGSWGRSERSPSNPLYTAAVLAGFNRLGLKFERDFEAGADGISWVPIGTEISWLSKGAVWLSAYINDDGGWVLQRGMQSDVFLTAWVMQGLEPVFDITPPLVWLKQLQNRDGGFGRYKNSPSDPEITAIAVMALSAGNDPLNTRRVAISYLTNTRQEDGSFVSNTPMELKEPTANLQSTCFVLIAIHAKTPDELAID